MSKEQLRHKIEEARALLNSQIASREDLVKCCELSEELDRLIEQYMEL